MKKILPAFLVVALLASGCESFNNRLNLKIQNEFVLDNSFVIDTTSMPEWVPFEFATSGSHYLQTALDGYCESIQDIELIDLSIQVNGLTKEIDLINTRFRISSGELECLWQFDELILYEDYSSSLEDTEGQWDILRQMLNEQKEISFSTSGEVEKLILNFTLSLSIQTEISAED